MLNRIKSWFRGKPSTKSLSSTAVLMDSMTTGGGVALHQFANYESYLEAGTRKVWATFKSCDLVGQSVMDTPFGLYRNKGTKPVEVQGLSDLLKAPNDTMTFAELLYLTVCHLKMTGNAFWAKDQPNANGDRPLALYPLNPKRIKIVPNKDRPGVSGYLYRPNNTLEPIPFEANEVMHFKRPHPNNDYWGLGDIEAAEPMFNDHINRSAWAEGFWKNGASPSGVLICKEQVSDQNAWDKAKAKWQKDYGGKGNAGKTAWLTGDWRYEQLGFSSQEMQDIEKQKYEIESIFVLHGVPLSVAGIRDAANYATAAIDDQRYRQYTVKPMIKIIQDTTNTDLVVGFGEGLELRFNLSGLTNVAQVVESYVQLFDRGVISVNEFRELIGRERIEDALYEQHFISAGLVPIDLAGVQDTQPAAAAAQDIVKRFMAGPVKGNGDHVRP
jgi:HK97 family phage portal protein